MNANQAITNVLQLGSKYPRQVAWVRVVVGIWLLCLTAILYSSGHGGHWAWLLVVGSVVHFGLAYRLLRIAARDSNRRLRFR
jgi:uncharacterized membrane protein YczE